MNVQTPLRFPSTLRRRGSRRHRVPGLAASREAFTLVELVIVVLIVGILAAAAGPRFANSLMYYRAEAAAQRIRADLELARKHAMTSSTSQQVVFSTVSNGYTLSDMTHLDHPSLQYEVKLSEAPYFASLSSVNFGVEGKVTFDGYGVPDLGGSVVVQAGAYQKTITLDPDSGRATVE